MSAGVPLWKVAISTTSEAEDAVTELLLGHFEQPVSSFTDVETGEVIVATYLTKKRRRAAALQDATALRHALRQIKGCGLKIGSGKVSIRKLRRQDWAESWKRHFKPLDIGSALLIKPSWSKRRPSKGQAVIVLDPGLSFGTGQHPTTEFCLRQLASHRSKLEQRPMPRRSSIPSFLDIGTGSGILAIAAAKLGYAPVHAFDFDPEAVRVARENARRNHVLAKVRITRADITESSISPVEKYDLICANLISTLLVSERRRILARLKRDGILVLAGILNVEFSSVQKAFEQAGLCLIASRIGKEWRSGAFTYRRQNR
jgi:ribosomal protein L11 methyltransferase